MKRMITAGLSTLVLTTIATSQVHAIATPDLNNCVQQVLQPNEKIDCEEAQKTMLKPAMVITQPMSQPQQEQPTNQVEDVSPDETLGFEYFERQYLDRHGS